MTEKIQIKISDILRMLKEGYTRKDLAEHYGLTQSAMKNIFQHPELKGKRTITPVEEIYNLVDDVTSGEVEEVPAEVQGAENVEAEAEHQEEIQALEEEDYTDITAPWKTA